MWRKMCKAERALLALALRAESATVRQAAAWQRGCGLGKVTPLWGNHCFTLLYCQQRLEQLELQICAEKGKWAEWVFEK